MEAFAAVFCAKKTAVYLNMSVSSVYRLVAAGKLQPLKIGGKTLFRRSDLDALLAASVAPLSRIQGKSARVAAGKDRSHARIDIFA